MTASPPLQAVKIEKPLLTLRPAICEPLEIVGGRTSLSQETPRTMVDRLLPMVFMDAAMVGMPQVFRESE